MLQSAECWRHAKRCAALARQTTEPRSKAMWGGMAMRWLQRAGAKQPPIRQKDEAKAINFKSQPRFDLVIQPIVRVLRSTRT
jgi:hypothetical protein